ncbi:hypothetical protein K3727_12470 [Rhodobacteraceae bacterium M382]|nr:hypothetical protein K3727_12470 [Rhodobacteraceae bacterium M382]
MTRILTFLILAVFTGGAAAQTVDPIVTAELSAQSTVVGQPVILRVTVLVPTWFPEPPSYPSMEEPNLIVRLPERASSPTSKQIDGETWSGITRAYRIYPMVPGEFVLPQRTIALTYADPDTSQPIEAEVTVDAIRFASQVPQGAEDLSPLIVAESFTLSETIDGAQDTLAQGDAVTRQVTATISGTSALFIPPLIPALVSDAARAYPKDPSVQESTNRGVLSGTRRETVSYVAQFGGTVELAPISVEWFNTGTNTVETATVAGTTVKVDAPAAPAAAQMSRRQMAVILAGVILLGLISWVAKTYLVPPLAHLKATRKRAWLTSEPYAARRVQQAITSRDLAGAHRAIARWSAKCPGFNPDNLDNALAGVGRQAYGTTRTNTDAWMILSAEFTDLRAAHFAGRATNKVGLPPLNG